MEEMFFNEVIFVSYIPKACMLCLRGSLTLGFPLLTASSSFAEDIVMVLLFC